MTSVVWIYVICVSRAMTEIPSVSSARRGCWLREKVPAAAVQAGAGAGAAFGLGETSAQLVTDRTV